MKMTTNNKLGWWPKRLPILQVGLIAYLLFPSTAFAYVDPGSGSVIVTTILGLIAAIGYTFRKYFYKIKRMITGGKMPEEDEEDQAVDEQQGKE